MSTVASPQLDENAAKGRYGVTYLDTVVTAAGYDMTEPRPGADMLAYDATVHFPEGDVRVQVKTSDKWPIAGTNERFTYTAKPGWVESWAKQQCPVYFLVVLVPKNLDWLEHGPFGTTLVQTAGYWSRIEPVDFTPSNMAVAGLRSQRLSAATFEDWRTDVRDGFRPYGGAR